LFERCCVVPDMQPEKIDIVDMETTKASLQRLHHIFAMVSAIIHDGTFVVQAVFRCDDPLFSLSADKFSDEFFARSVCIHIRCIDEITTCLCVGVKNFTTLFEIRSPFPLFPESHCS